MSTLMLAGAALLLLVLVGVCLPLLRRPVKLPERDQFDRAVYRDQLGEVDNDVARGVLSTSEAEPTRLEIQRRLLNVKANAATPVGIPTRSPRLAVTVALVISFGAGGIYWQLGAPSLEDVPFVIQAAQAQETQKEAPSPHASNGHGDFRAAAEKLQQKLAADPNNAEGWELYARTESRIGDWQRAADAYRRAIELGRKSATVYAGLGEMLVLGAQGVVLPPARESFTAALRIDPGDQVSRFYVALADSQAGEARKAVDGWLSLAADVPDDDPMREEIANRIGVAAKSGGFPPPPLPKGPTPDGPSAAGGPNAAQMAAAEQMSPADRDKMIHDMIDQLAAKLAKQPDDADGWLRLANAYGVQGQSDKAADAFDHAMKLRPNDPTIKLESVATMISRLQATDAIPPRAITLLQEVATVAPDAPEVLWYLGIVAAREGRHDDARKDWTRLLAKLDSASEDYKTVQGAMAELPAAR